MKVKKDINGKLVELKLRKIQEYKTFSLYQVTKFVNGKEIATYRECYTPKQLNKIIENGNIIGDDNFD